MKTVADSYNQNLVTTANNVCDEQSQADQRHLVAAFSSSPEERDTEYLEPIPEEFRRHRPQRVLLGRLCHPPVVTISN